MSTRKFGVVLRIDQYDRLKQLSGKASMGEFIRNAIDGAYNLESKSLRREPLCLSAGLSMRKLCIGG